MTTEWEGTASTAPAAEGSGSDVAALELYLATLQAGHRPSREAFLADHPDLTGELARCLDVLEFIHSAARIDSTGGDMPLPADSLAPETVLGDYRLIREAGRGGMGIVYEAEQVPLARRVALKVLPAAAALDARRVQRFRIEAQAAAQLSHPHIVPVYDVGSERGFHYYAMRFIEGRSLAAVIRDRQGSEGTTDHPPPAGHPAGGPLARAVASIGLQAAEALEHAHSLGVLHRDIKPGNLLFDETGGLWVADFGLARLRDDPGPTLTGDVLGTLRYMSPEQVLARRGVVDQRADVYALGATLYEALTLRPAFDGRDRQSLLHQVLFDEPTPPRRIDSTIPRSLETVVLKAMAKESSGRYATARELADDLRRFLADSPVLARPQSSFDRAARWVRRHRTAVATALTALVLTLSVSSVLLWRERDRTASALDESRRALDRESRAMDMIVMAAHAVTMRAMAVVTIRGERDNNPTDRPFLEEALAFYQSVERMTRDDPHRREATGKAWFGIGLTRWLLGRTDAEEAFRRSIASYDRLLADAPSEDRRLQRLASLKYLGLVVHQARGLAQSEPIFRSLLAEERGLIASGRSGRVPTIYLANDLRIWGQMLEEAGRREDAEKAIREANEMAPSQER
jgi:eukaryotic-like serine/threonine-protein kinase